MPSGAGDAACGWLCLEAAFLGWDWDPVGAGLGHHGPVRAGQGHHGPVGTGQDHHGPVGVSHEGVEAEELASEASLGACWHPGKRRVLWVI